MKKISFIAAILLISALTIPYLASAQGGINRVQPKPSVNLVTIIDAVLGWAFGLLIVLAALFIIYAAFLFLTGGGSETSTEKAKKLIIYAVVAIIVGFLSRGLVLIVRQLLGT